MPGRSADVHENVDDCTLCFKKRSLAASHCAKYMCNIVNIKLLQIMYFNIDNDVDDLVH